MFLLLVVTVMISVQASFPRCCELKHRRSILYIIRQCSCDNNTRADKQKNKQVNKTVIFLLGYEILFAFIVMLSSSTKLSASSACLKTDTLFIVLTKTMSIN